MKFMGMARRRRAHPKPGDLLPEITYLIAFW
jgi:hypothetical protein